MSCSDESPSQIHGRFTTSVSEHDYQIPSTVTVSVPQGPTFIMEVTEKKGDIVLHNGWIAFSRTYSVKSDYRVMFQLKTPSHFEVRFFEKNGPEIRYQDHVISAPIVSHLEVLLKIDHRDSYEEGMSGKGGKGYEPANGGKSSLKSPVGNGGSSSKKGKGKGKSVQFDDSEDSGDDVILMSNGNADTPAPKGGKGDRVANGTKKPTDKASSPPDVELKIDQELPPKTVCLMDCEAAEIMQGIQEQMVFLSQDPDIKLPVSFDKGLTYAKRSENPVKPETVKRIFDPLKKYGVSESEICLIVNICPESADDVFTLIPSLKPKMSRLRDPLKISLDELANLKQRLANLRKSRE